MAFRECQVHPESDEWKGRYRKNQIEPYIDLATSVISIMILNGKVCSPSVSGGIPFSGTGALFLDLMNAFCKLPLNFSSIQLTGVHASDMIQRNNKTQTG